MSQSGTNLPSLEPAVDKGSGDLYRGMEVSIIAGSLKMHRGVVKGTREHDDRTMVDVLLSTQVQNTLVALDSKDVREL